MIRVKNGKIIDYGLKIGNNIKTNDQIFKIITGNDKK